MGSLGVRDFILDASLIHTTDRVNVTGTISHLRKLRHTIVKAMAICTTTFTAAIFTIPKKWKQP